MWRFVEEENTPAFKELAANRHIKIYADANAPRDPQDVLVAASAMADSSSAGVACSLRDKSMSTTIQWANRYGAVPNNREPDRHLTDGFCRDFATVAENTRAPFQQAYSHQASRYSTIIPSESSLPAIVAKTQYKEAESRSTSSFKASPSASAFLSSHLIRDKPSGSFNPLYHEDTVNRKTPGIIDDSSWTSGQGVRYTLPLPLPLEKSSIDFSGNIRYTSMDARITALSGTAESRKEDRTELMEYIPWRSLELEPSPFECEARGKSKAFETERTARAAETGSFEKETLGANAFDENIENCRRKRQQKTRLRSTQPRQSKKKKRPDSEMQLRSR